MKKYILTLFLLLISSVLVAKRTTNKDITLGVVFEAVALFIEEENPQIANFLYLLSLCNMLSSKKYFTEIWNGIKTNDWECTTTRYSTHMKRRIFISRVFILLCALLSMYEFSFLKKLKLHLNPKIIAINSTLSTILWKFSRELMRKSYRIRF